MKRKINCIMFDLATSKGGGWSGGKRTPNCFSKCQSLPKGIYHTETPDTMGIIGFYIGHCPWALGGDGVCVGGALVSAPGASGSIKAY